MQEEYHVLARVSAPGKLLLLGEHAVVYGCPVVAAAVSDLRVRVQITRRHVNKGDAPTIEFVCKDFKSAREGAPLRRAFAIAALQQVVDQLEDDVHYVPVPGETVLSRIENVLQAELPQDAKILRAPLFLCCALLRSSVIFSGNAQGLVVEIESCNLPIGAGLGSSGATSVALAGAFGDVSGCPQKQELEFINKYAYSAEVILHGSPSGADNTVSCFGGTLVFQKHATPAFRDVKCELNKFRFLIVNTRVPRSTKEQVANVRKRYEADRDGVQKQFDTIQAIVEQFLARSEANNLSEQVLGQLMEHNQTILNDLGVGHARIDEVARLCKQYNGWTKLTGAGGGGCVISLLPQSLSEEDVATLTNQLKAEGFDCFATFIGGPGFLRD
ncbi:hypothetical protein PsorP6_007848 [Peronosclerospora sorghi]|uniref:Uncharacterized protein n=1 Tax=Peronosclerospora sorghi TaxID=230839 RepID=A0ACC0W8T0_9STRA|nr:hypothetical protein PsorP6_007848 [Peronosclerospora sorghi]